MPNVWTPLKSAVCQMYEPFFETFGASLMLMISLLLVVTSQVLVPARFHSSFGIETCSMICTESWLFCLWILISCFPNQCDACTPIWNWLGVYKCIQAFVTVVKIIMHFQGDICLLSCDRFYLFILNFVCSLLVWALKWKQIWLVLKVLIYLYAV